MPSAPCSHSPSPPFTLSGRLPKPRAGIPGPRSFCECGECGQSTKGGRESLGWLRAAHRPAAWDIESTTPQPMPPTCTSPRSGPRTHGALRQAPGRTWRRVVHRAVRLLADAEEAREPAVSVFLLFPPHTWSLRGSDGGVSVTTPGGNDSPRSRATRALFSPQAWTAAPCWADSGVQTSSLKLLVVKDTGTETGLSLEPTTSRNPGLRRRAWVRTSEKSALGT